MDAYNLCVMNLNNIDVNKSKNFLKSARPFSKALGKLLIFLIHQQPNLSKFSLAKPYNLIRKTCPNYCLQGYIHTINPYWIAHLNNSKNGFGTKPSDYMGNQISLMPAYGKKNYILDIDPRLLSVNIDYRGLNDQEFANSQAFDFGTDGLWHGLYPIDLARNDSSKPVTDYTEVQCFIGMVVTTKKLIDNNIKEIEGTLNPVINQTKHQKKTLPEILADAKAKQRRMDNSKYSWDNIFKKTTKTNK